MTPVGSRAVHGTATYRCDDTRCRVIQFWPPDDEHIVLETCKGIWWTYYKRRICALSWLITKMWLAKLYAADTTTGAALINKVYKLSGARKDNAKCLPAQCYPIFQTALLCLRVPKLRHLLLIKAVWARQWVWSIREMLLQEESRGTRRKPCLSATFFHNSLNVSEIFKNSLPYSTHDVSPLRRQTV